MQLQVLTEQEIRTVYTQHLSKDFPRSERRPLSSVLDLLKKGNYHCLGAYAGGALAAYAFFALARDTDVSLLDYFATDESRRGTGIGSRFWKVLPQQMPSPILLEVESLRSAETPEEKETRTRRIAFYEKNGCRMTGIHAKVFGVEYSIMKSDNRLDDLQARAALDKLYRTIFPLPIYKTMIRYEP